MANLKLSLLELQKVLQEGDLDKLLEGIQSLPSLEGLTLEEAQECLRILDHLILLAQEKQNQIVQALVNIKRFKAVL